MSFRWSALLVAALVVGAMLANALLPENGYVAIGFAGRLVEMSVPTLVLLVLLTLLGLEVLTRLVRLPRERRERRLEKRRERAREDLSRGILELASGRWAEAEVTLTRSARDARWPAAHYVTAARAADLQNRVERRDGWLALALEAAPDEPAPALVTQAEMQLKRGALDAALDSLETLGRFGKLGPRALLLLARVYRQRGDFAKLRELEPKLRDTRGVAPASVDEIVDNLYLDMLKVAADRGGLPAVEAVWGEATRAARRRPAIVVEFARALAQHGEPARAAKELATLLDAEWHEPAVLLYGEIDGADALERLRVAEGWLRARRDDPALLVACARLCQRAELYGKARSYLETSWGLRPRPETAQLLAQLHEELGDRDRAMRVLEQGLALSTGRRADLPPVRQRRLHAPRR